MAKRIYLSFALDDKKYADELQKHLKVLSRAGHVEIRDDDSLGLGAESRDARLDALDWAEIAIFLVSPDLFSDDEVMDHVLPRAKKRQEQGLPIIPILVRTTDVALTHFDGRVMLPRDRKPVGEPKNDEAWTKIVKELRQSFVTEDRQLSLLQVSTGEIDTGNIPDDIALTGKQIGDLRDALAKAFPSWRKMEMMLTIQLNRSLGDIASQNTGMTEVAFSVVIQYQEESRLGELIRGAARASSNKLLREFVESLSKSTEPVA